MPRPSAPRASGATDVALLASLVGDPICKKYPELAVKVNQDGAKAIIDSLDDLGVQRFVFTSTCSNYGIHDPSSLATETSELNPQSLYATTKIASRSICWRCRRRRRSRAPCCASPPPMACRRACDST